VAAGNCFTREGKEQEISSYFPRLIAVSRNKFLFEGPCLLRLEATPVTDFPHHPQRLLARLRLDSWAVAIATALLALILLGILPRIHW
jgi:hypothetical protein